MNQKKKQSDQLELAVYGKGGIGKSTVSANLSAALSLRGKKVLQIGCDPKHDSTRLLMHGENIPTILECLKNREKTQVALEDVLKEGCLGIGCVEAGGPQPGVGCAGRGIISAFEFLKEHQVKERYDLVLYDVLGDVVCGGFAVPVRREYANAIFLVTSGEYMAIYAANNILRGIRNYDGDTCRRVAGIIYNERKINEEDSRVQRFADAVGLPVCAKIPRSNAFARAEQENRPLMELEDDQAKVEKEIFLQLADQIESGLTLYEARPLTDEELEKAVLGTGRLENGDTESDDSIPCSGQVFHTDDRQEKDQSAKTRGEEPTRESGLSQPLPQTPSGRRPPLYGCAFNGAATAGIHLTDAIVIAHAPKACAFYTWQNISSPGRKNLFNRGILMPSAISPNFECTDMEQAEVVFGGMDNLKAKIAGAMKRKPGAVIVISSCVSGIIGDDIREAESLSTKEIPVITIHADGDIAGDYMHGIRMTMHTLAERLIDRSVRPAGKKVNLVNETGVSYNLDINYRTVKYLLDGLGIEINCRYLGDATCEEVRHFLAAPVNLLAVDNADGRELKNWLGESYGCRFLDEPFPVGFEASARWLRKLGRIFGCEKQAEEMIQKEERRYREALLELRRELRGKRIFMTTINTNMDWLLETASDIGMEFLQIGVLNYLHQEVKITDHPERYPIVEDFDWTQIHTVIRDLGPDLVLGNYAAEKEGDWVVDATPMSPVAGFHSGIHAARRWAELLRHHRKGEWIRDRALFEKYYA